MLRTKSLRTRNVALACIYAVAVVGNVVGWGVLGWSY